MQSCLVTDTRPWWMRPLPQLVPDRSAMQQFLLSQRCTATLSPSSGCARTRRSSHHKLSSSSSLASGSTRRYAAQATGVICGAATATAGRQQALHTPAVPEHWQDHLERLQGSGAKRRLLRYFDTVQQINALEHGVRALSDKELKGATGRFRARLAAGEQLDALLPDAFAVVREAARRVLDMRHYDVQLVGGMVLHEGQIAEMQTGEGKTLTAALPAYLNALTGQGVHIVTVNDYLAKRDAEWVGKVFVELGLSVGVVQELDDLPLVKQAFACDITYVTANALCFAYLRDNMVFDTRFMTLLDATSSEPTSKLHFAIVDEVDFLLIDECRNPLLIAGNPTGVLDRYTTAAKVAKKLKEKQDQRDAWVVPKKKYLSTTLHYTQEEIDREYPPADDWYIVDRRKQSLFLTQKGLQATLQVLCSDLGVIIEGAPQPQPHDLWDHEQPWGPYILNALKAEELHQRNVSYIVIGDEVKLINTSTGRVLERSRLTERMHQALEAKEGVPVQQETSTMASITYQCFFNYYKKLAGMTGTAVTEQEELYDTYRLNVVQVPPHRPVQRTDHPHALYFTEVEKLRRIAELTVEAILYPSDRQQWAAVDRMRDAKERMGSNIYDVLYRPVLIGTSSVAESEDVLELLTHYIDRFTTIEVLNANPQSVRREAQIIAQAGMPGQVTIATNMAGRGTDIILGGNPKGLVEAVLHRFMAEDIVFKGSPGTELPTETLAGRLPVFDNEAAMRRGLPRTVYEAILRAKGVTSIAFKDKRVDWAAADQLLAVVVEQAEVLHAQIMRESRRRASEAAKPGQDHAGTNQWEEHVQSLAADDVPVFTAFQRLAPLARQVLADWAERLLPGQPERRHLVFAATWAWLWIAAKCQLLGQQVREAGGLVVIGSSLQASKRIELQLRGRAGRQGDPGETYMLVGTNDQLLQDMGLSGLIEGLTGGQLKAVGPLGEAPAFATQQFVSNAHRMMRQLASSPRADLRKYDEVVETFRRLTYQLRHRIVCGTRTQRHSILYLYFQDCVDTVVSTMIDGALPPERWDVAALAKGLASVLQPDIQAALTLVNPDAGVCILDLQKELARVVRLLQGANSGGGLLSRLLVAGPPAPAALGPPQQGEFWQRAYSANQLVYEEHRRLLASKDIAAQRPLLRGRYAPQAAALRDYLGELMIMMYQTKAMLAQALWAQAYQRRQGGEPPAPADVAAALRHGEVDLMAGQLDELWADFLMDLDDLRRAVSIRVCTQQEPLDEFRQEAAAAYNKLLATLRANVTYVAQTSPEYWQMVVQIKLDTKQVEEEAVRLAGAREQGSRSTAGGKGPMIDVETAKGNQENAHVPDRANDGVPVAALAHQGGAQQQTAGELVPLAGVTPTTLALRGLGGN